jgi:peptide/nickel transport system substrate-binding protein
VVALVAAALSIGVVAGAAAGTSHRSALPVLRIGITIDNASLDLTKAGNAGGYTAEACDLAYGGLFHYKPDGTVSPELALTYRYLKSGHGANKDFEFTLRKGVRFSDGSPFTAQAVASWMDYFAKNGVGYGTFLGPSPRFEAIGRYTVRMHLTIPVPNLQKIVSDDGFNVWGCPASPKAVANPTLMATGTYGAGPYMIDPSQSVTHDHYTYVPNPYYYDKKAIKFSRVYVKVITNPSTMLQALQAGQLDVAQGDITTAAAAQSGGFGIAGAVSQQFALFLNPKNNPALKDVRVRQAINYAMDRKTVVSALLGKYGRPTSEVITADADPGLENYYPYNPTKAKALLKAAGYPNGITLTILDDNFIGTPGDPLVQAYAKYWEAAGIHVKITAASLNEWLRDYPKYDAFQGGITINTTPSRYGIFLNPKSSYTTWGGPAVDQQIYKLYWAGLKAKDPIPIWKKMWERFTKQAYFVPLTAYEYLYFYNKHITGVPASVDVRRPSTPLFTEWGYK